MPVHVTIRMQPRVYNLRSRRGMMALGRAFFGGKDRFGLRLVHFAVQGNHVHFVVEAQGHGALSRGMQGLNIRIARALNRMMAKSGAVLDDRYHAHILKTPAEAKAALHYLSKNHETHTKEQGADPFCSLSRVERPEWLTVHLWVVDSTVWLLTSARRTQRGTRG